MEKEYNIGDVILTDIYSNSIKQYRLIIGENCNYYIVLSSKKEISFLLRVGDEEIKDYNIDEKFIGKFVRYCSGSTIINKVEGSSYCSECYTIFPFISLGENFKCWSCYV